MGVCGWLVFGLLAVVISSSVKFYITAGIFEHIFNHRPGKCIKFHMNGSEDIVLLPNGQALITSGLMIDPYLPRPDPGVYLFDMTSPVLSSPDKETPGPRKLEIRGNSLLQRSYSFMPHGMGYWSSDKGIFLYVINHRTEHKDAVEVLQYFPDDPRGPYLEYRRSIEHPLLYNMNNLQLVGEGEFYVTIDRFYQGNKLKEWETFLRLPFSRVVYCNEKSGEVKIVANGLSYANGIAASTDYRFVYVSNLLEGTLIAYARKAEDNSLKEIQRIPVQMVIDNLFVDQDNGHLWLGVMPQPLKTLTYFRNLSEPCPSKVLHLAIDESSDTPFSDYKVEQVLQDDGNYLKASTVAVYHKNKLLVGTVMQDLLYCEVPHPLYITSPSSN